MEIGIGRLLRLGDYFQLYIVRYKKDTKEKIQKKKRYKRKDTKERMPLHNRISQERRENAAAFCFIILF